MKAVILGSGNVAEALAAAITAPRQVLRQATIRHATVEHATSRQTAVNQADGLELVQFYGRSAAGSELAERFGVPFTDSLTALVEADIYIMAVSDGAIGELSSRMRIPAGAVVAHTAGGVSIDALSPRIVHRAVFYPLQTFTKGRDVDFAEVPVFIEYGDAFAGDTVRRMAGMLSKNVAEADSALRVKLHVAAVFACNFVNHLYSFGGNMLEEEGLSFDILAPIITETARKAIASGNPAEVQTGPAVRGDLTTMRRHIELLAAEGKTNYETIYKLLSQSIWETSKKTSRE